ncbi:MAG: class I SAM-dependent methyltransferase [Myxococcales bacterium]|nr:class I SAM-dependent methyltransferase [Myxococcota bacterium]MDW8282521.1 class I SAM-dependent methyltransferase [Myxococcales bacterium]
MRTLPSPGANLPEPWNLHHSRRLFDECWGRAAASPSSDPGNERRLAAIVGMCPLVDSVLDVGCGDGELLRALAARARRRYGCDTSAVGLQRLGRDGTVRVVQAAADRLPFADRAFELVACCDVLEHLPEETVAAALCEIMRVAARYVLLNVPLNEDLGWSEIRCHCGRLYHRDHHQRSYTAWQVEEMLPAARFRLLGRCTTGWTVRRLLRLPRGLGAALSLGHDLAARCDRCGEHPAPLRPAQRLLRDVFVRCHHALTRPLAGLLSQDSEIVVLFGRRS